MCKEDEKDYFDSQGDNINETEMRKAATGFMINSREAREMHGKVCKGKVIHSLPFTTELAESLGMDEIPRTGWIVGIKPESDEVLQKYKSGEYTGFSIGGSAKREAVK